jgi:hypothetical protein
MTFAQALFNCKRKTECIGIYETRGLFVFDLSDSIYELTAINEIDLTSDIWQILSKEELVDENL